MMRAPRKAAKKIYPERTLKDVAMHGPDEGDVIEQGGRPLRLPPWARRPRWLPGPGGLPSRGAVLFGLAALVVGLAAGYALGDRHSAPPSRPAPSAASASTSSGPGVDDLFGLAQTGERPNRHGAAGGGLIPVWSRGQWRP
jgi:hypothetical protein